MNRGYKPNDFEQERIDVSFAGFLIGGMIGFSLGLLAAPYVAALFS